MPTAKSKIKVLHRTEGPSIWEWVISYNDHKFQIYTAHTNGTPLGFNYKCSLSIMTPSGTWSHIADNLELGFEWDNLYWSHDEQKKAQVAQDAYERFIKYVKAVY